MKTLIKFAKGGSRPGRGTGLLQTVTTPRLFQSQHRNENDLPLPETRNPLPSSVFLSSLRLCASAVKISTLILGVFAFGGCASHKSTVLERTNEDGSTTRLTRSATRTFFDSKTRLAENAVQSRSGSNVQSIAIGSLDQESSGTNAVELGRITLDILRELKGAKLPNTP